MQGRARGGLVGEGVAAGCRGRPGGPAPPDAPGAVGSDPKTGDGAGLLVAIPDGFFRRLHPDLPAKGRYGIGMLFGGEVDEEAIGRILGEEGLRVLFWR